MSFRTRALPALSAAALLLPTGIGAVAFATSAEAAPIVSDNGGDAIYNHTGTWEGILRAKGYTNVSCVKFDGRGTTWTAQQDYVLVVIKAGSSSSVTEPNEQHWGVSAGTTLGHSSKKGLSHIIACAGTLGTTPTTDTTSTTTSTTTATETETKTKTNTATETETKTNTATKPVIVPTTTTVTAPTATVTSPAPTATVTTPAPAVKTPAPAAKAPAKAPAAAPGKIAQKSPVVAAPSEEMPPALAQTGSSRTVAGFATALGLIGAGAGLIAVSRRRND